MQKSKIEWTDFTINPVKGLCPVGCSYCYARRMYKRFKWDETIKLDVDSFIPLLATTKIKPSKVFVGSTMELFCEWVKPEWMKFIFDRVRLLPEHTFIFLTKQPQNLIKYSPFPENCWVGVSNTGGSSLWVTLTLLNQIKASVKFLSFEPLLNEVRTYPEIFESFHPDSPVKYISDNLKNTHISWLIIGQQTPASPKTAPKIEWIKEIVEAADKAKIPVFLKNNLEPVLRTNRTDGLIPTGFCTNYGHSLRQDFPIKEEKYG